MVVETPDSGAGLSVIVPVYNEQGSVLELYQRLTAVLVQTATEYEIVLVDDGSFDGSTAILQRLAETDGHVVVVKLRRNFGKATALQAGFQIARGDIFVTMDGDLQDEPAEIPRFLEALGTGLDVVSGWKKNRQDPLSKTLPSRFFNSVTARLTGIRIHDFNCGFKAYRREAVAGLDLYGELHRYIPVLVHAKGFRVGEIVVEHHPRLHGKSKYRAERFLRGAFDLATVLFLSSFQRRPLHLFGTIGLLAAFAGFVADLYLAILWFLGRGPIGSRPLLTLGTLLIVTGVQLVIFGLLAEMIAAASYRRSEVGGLVERVYRASDGPRATQEGKASPAHE
jgi:glycosyltransferase involved in cell wall biosynthesis